MDVPRVEAARQERRPARTGGRPAGRGRSREGRGSASRCSTSSRKLSGEPLLRVVCGRRIALKDVKDRVRRTTTRCTASAGWSTGSRTPTCRTRALAVPPEQERPKGEVPRSRYRQRDQPRSAVPRPPRDATPAGGTDGGRKEVLHERSSTRPGKTPSTRHKGRERPHRQRHRDGGSRASDAAGLRALPRKTVPTTLTKQTTASPPISASPAMVARRTPAGPLLFPRRPRGPDRSRTRSRSR